MLRSAIEPASPAVTALLVAALAALSSVVCLGYAVAGELYNDPTLSMRPGPSTLGSDNNPYGTVVDDNAYSLTNTPGNASAGAYISDDMYGLAPDSRQTRAAHPH